MLPKPRILIYRFLYRLARLYWKIFQPKNESAVCLIKCDNKILMVRNTYGDRKWVLPGGGCQNGETAEKSAQREAFEEVGIKLEKLLDFGVFTDTIINKNARVYCFYGEVENQWTRIDENEIAEAGWFDLSNLPESISVDALAIINLYQAQNQQKTL